MTIKEHIASMKEKRTDFQVPAIFTETETDSYLVAA